MSDSSNVISILKDLPVHRQIDLAHATLMQSRASTPARITAPSVEREVSALNSQPGANPILKGISLLASRDPAFKRLDYGEQCRLAGVHVNTLLAGNAPQAVSSTPAPTANADRAKTILDAIGKMPGADMEAKCVAYAAANNILTVTSVGPDVQRSAAAGVLAKLARGDTSDFETPDQMQPTTVASMIGLLNSQKGRNPVEKAVILLSSRNATFKSKDLGAQCFEAGQFVNTLMAGRMPPAGGV